MRNHIVRCPECGAANRIPADKIGQAAKCGKCQAILPAGQKKTVQGESIKMRCTECGRIKDVFPVEPTPRPVELEGFRVTGHRLEYLGVSDHLRSERHTEGLDAAGEAEQFQEIAGLRREFPDFDLLHGLEVDAAPDGSVELPPDVLERLDYVIVSLTEPDGHTKDSYTDAALKVIRHPSVDVVSRPVGAYMLTKPPVPLDMMRVLKAAAESRTVVELDANPACADLDGTHCRLAADLDVSLAINPNAHRAARLVDYRQGVEIAREMGLDCRQFVNTLTATALRERFKRDGRSG